MQMLICSQADRQAEFHAIEFPSEDRYLFETRAAMLMYTTTHDWTLTQVVRNFDELTTEWIFQREDPFEVDRTDGYELEDTFMCVLTDGRAIDGFSRMTNEQLVEANAKAFRATDGNWYYEKTECSCDVYDFQRGDNPKLAGPSHNTSCPLYIPF